MGKGRIVIGIAATLAAVLAVWSMVRTDPGPRLRARAAREAEAVRLWSVGQDAFALVPMRPVAEFASPADLAAPLARAECEGEVPPDGLPSELVEKAGQFLWNFFVNQDPAIYREWRVASGYAPRSDAWASAPWARSFIPPASPAAGDGVPMQDRFDAIWNMWRSVPGGPGGPRGFPDDPSGWVWRFGSLSLAHPAREPIGGTLGVGVWNGTSRGSITPWFTPAHLAPYDNFFAAFPDRTLNYAELGVVVEYADGSRRPMMMLFFQDPRDHSWWLNSVEVRNFNPRVFNATPVL